LFNFDFFLVQRLWRDPGPTLSDFYNAFMTNPKPVDPSLLRGLAFQLFYFVARLRFIDVVP
jgi:hypothetical protein